MLILNQTVRAFGKYLCLLFSCIIYIISDSWDIQPPFS